MKKLFAISLCLVIVLTACLPTVGTQTQAVDSNAAVQTAVAGTKAVQNAVATSVALTAAAQQQEVSVNNPPATTEPPPPPANPVASVPSAIANFNANCRMGPAGSFELVLMLKQGQGGNIIGKNSAGLIPWYKLELPDGRQCWVSGDSLTISGDVSGVQEIASPPTPTPVPPPSWAGTWNIWQWWLVNGTDVINQNVTFYQSGTKLTASWTARNWKWELVGTVSADGMRVDGTISGLVFIFERNPDNLNQFRGIYTNTMAGSGWDGDFCGAKAGSSKPSPCRNIH